MIDREIKFRSKDMPDVTWGSFTAIIDNQNRGRFFHKTQFEKLRPLTWSPVIRTVTHLVHIEQFFVAQLLLIAEEQNIVYPIAIRRIRVAVRY